MIRLKRSWTNLAACAFNQRNTGSIRRAFTLPRPIKADNQPPSRSGPVIHIRETVPHGRRCSFPAVGAAPDVNRAWRNHRGNQGCMQPVAPAIRCHVSNAAGVNAAIARRVETFDFKSPDTPPASGQAGMLTACKPQSFFKWQIPVPQVFAHH